MHLRNARLNFKAAPLYLLFHLSDFSTFRLSSGLSEVIKIDKTEGQHKSIVDPLIFI